MAQSLLGKQLVFISWIKRDGSGTLPIGTKVDESEKGIPKIDDVSHMDNDTFTLFPLSISYGTYIAIGFNSFVVKIRKSK